MDSRQIQTKLGERVRVLRKARGWSQEELAGRALLHPTYIGSIERGERNVSLINLAKLAAAFDVSLAVLLSFPEDNGHPQEEPGEKKIRELIAGNDLLAIAFFQTFCRQCETLKQFRTLQAMVPRRGTPEDPV
ncbi:MAG: helix-turn-helix domain-containing protein [Nitrospira sp.]|nr:helix-turn-helix domain-containing protein [Nitrospira sp.]MCP9442847.1 helix-turn-helix domain-containing protein [Nitrospira sp.]